MFILNAHSMIRVKAFLVRHLSYIDLREKTLESISGRVWSFPPPLCIAFPVFGEKYDIRISLLCSSEQLIQIIKMYNDLIDNLINYIMLDD
jgi:hypothetical protein